jgi:oxalate decarboxylase/phosphoglucose isomerase-like protein (cupin superfamily)
MDDEGKVYRTLIEPGDVVAIPCGFFHSFLNTTTEDLVMYEMFYHAELAQEMNLINGVQHFSPHIMQGATGLPLSTIEKINQKKSSIYIDKF